ncbi:hypothetical protein MASR2M18_10760 [Ignavibacteria bacterium]|nr:hypothetical protein [Bacteroidota bacterium]MCZ2133465.1 hypothetical protein [Bacteroidota bacterium]
MELNLQRQYDLIYSYFKATAEPYDTLLWDGRKLLVLLNEAEIEEYTYCDLKMLINGF